MGAGSRQESPWRAMFFTTSRKSRERPLRPDRMLFAAIERGNEGLLEPTVVQNDSG